MSAYTFNMPYVRRQQKSGSTQEMDPDKWDQPVGGYGRRRAGSAGGYEHSAGLAAAAPEVWPRENLPSVTNGEQRGTLLVFVHPRCPCSLATANELARLVAKTRDRLAIRVIFMVPGSEPNGWEKGRLWDVVGEIPGRGAASWIATGY